MIFESLFKRGQRKPNPEPQFDEDGVYVHHKGKALTPDGEEILDPTPMEPPLGYKRQPSMVEHIRNMVRGEMLRQAAEAQGYGSFEEEDDFETDDYDDLPRSGYEHEFEPEVPQSAASAADGSGEAAKPGPEGPLAKPDPAPAPVTPKE